MRWMRRERDELAPQARIQAVADGSAPHALRQCAEQWHADLVIVGSHHLSVNRGHAGIGRRARQLLYDAPFAVGIAARGIAEPPPEVRSVGAGYDAGPEAEAALQMAAELARMAHARLAVRRVVEDRIPVFTDDEWMVQREWNHARIWENARMTALAEAKAAVSRLDIAADVTATLGDPGYELRAFSQTVDLIVVGSRRWGPVARLVTGGVGETLVAEAGCSVIIVPRPASRPPTEAHLRAQRPAIA
jgi:nucleotide-binding universal stress UspA family protein